MWIILIVFLLIFSCSRTYKQSPERIIYTNEVVEIKGKDAGLPEYLKNVYVSMENETIYDREFFYPFMVKLEFYISSYALKFEREDEANFAKLKGRIKSIVVSERYEITNTPHKFYTLKIVYSLLDEKNEFLQKDKEINEYLLVLNTNQYDLENSLNKLADISARHLSEAIKFGWQSDFTKTDKEFFTLGAIKSETNNITNREK